MKLLITAILLAHGMSAWIMWDPERNWCCTPGRDCLPVAEGALHSNGKDWWVDGLEGSKREGDIGFFWGTPTNQPWACGTDTLRCIMIPAPGA